LEGEKLTQKRPKPTQKRAKACKTITKACRTETERATPMCNESKWEGWSSFEEDGGGGESPLFWEHCLQASSAT
jgi:hypothetical protein